MSLEEACRWRYKQKWPSILTAGLTWYSENRDGVSLPITLIFSISMMNGSHVLQYLLWSLLRLVISSIISTSFSLMTHLSSDRIFGLHHSATIGLSAKIMNALIVLLRYSQMNFNLPPKISIPEHVSAAQDCVFSCHHVKIFCLAF